MNARIDELVGNLTVDEKAAMVAGVDLWHTAAVPRLGIPALKVTDGPAGARGERWTGRASASFPCGTALGATWNPQLVRTVGERIGGEARRKGAHVLLAPTVNIHRHPLAGRNFECYSEDPYLSARCAVEYIGGVQSTGVGCSVKHFVANDSEFERMTISSEVDARTLREISLVPFEAAVLEAGTWSVMAAYNRLHGTYCSEHPLLAGLLKGEWSFDGVIMSDWYGTHSTVPAATAGLDLEMPGPAQWFGSHLADAVRAGDVSELVLDDKVRRVLLLLDRTGGLDNPDAGPELSIDDPEDRAVARRAATESFVLLSNRGNTLPIVAGAAGGDTKPLLAVIGPNSALAMIQGGGSARVSPFSSVTPLTGLRERFGESFRIEHERGCSSYKQTPVLDLTVLDGPLRVAYYPGRERSGEPALVEPGDRGWFTFTGPFTPEVPEEFSMRISGTLVAPESGSWTFSLVQIGRARLSIDGEVVVDNWEPTGRSEAFMGFASSEVTGTIELVAGERHELEVEYVLAGPSMGALAIGCTPPAPADLLERAVALAVRADVVVCVVGTDGDWETEGNDRDSMALPPPQDELVRSVAGGQSAHHGGRQRGVAGADGLGRRRRCGTPVLVRGRGVGARTRRRAFGRCEPVGQVAHDHPGADRGHAGVHQLSRRARAGSVRRRRVRGLPLVRRAPDRSPILLRARTLLHHVRARCALGLGYRVGGEPATRRRTGSHRRARSQHRRAPGRRGGAVLRARCAVVGRPASARVEVVREGLAGSGRGGRGGARARSARVRVLGGRRRRSVDG